MERFKGEEGQVRVAGAGGVMMIQMLQFPSVQSKAYCPRGGAAYYEIEILRLGKFQIFGFCSGAWQRVDKLVNEGVGLDKESWGVEGARQKRLHNAPRMELWEAFGGKWSEGDVIGVACEVGVEGGVRVWVSVNGSWAPPNGLVFDHPDRTDVQRLHPALTGFECSIRVNLGAASWRHAPPAGGAYESFEALARRGV